MTAIQFPLKLSFACTAHKMQGSTVLKPDSLAIDLTSVREPAQGYVMLSRIQAIIQLFILNIFLSSKLFPSPAALEELKKLQELALNQVEKAKKDAVLISVLNVRSLPKHLENIKKDPKICGKVIALQETWCTQEHEPQSLSIQGYDVHLVNQGRGKGVATYFSGNFEISGAVNTNLYQMSKVSDGKVDIINIYISRGANKAEFLQHLGNLAKGSKNCFIVGDFNIDFLRNSNEPIIRTITSKGFTQMISTPSHLSGGLIDHIYVKYPDHEFETDVDFPFFSDHALISVIEKRS